MPNRVKEFASLVRNLFSDEEVTEINVKELVSIPLNEWQYINNRQIRYKLVEKNKTYCISITEWLEDSTFHKHLHRDAKEEIFVICGKVRSTMDRLSRKTFGKLFYSAGTIHEVEAKKGTKIVVKFEFK